MRKLQRTRLDDGWYRYYCKPPFATAEQKKIAKKDAKKNIKEKDVVGTCACCHRNMATGSDVGSIIETGLCLWCILYEERKVDYVICFESPTFEEVLDRAKKGCPLAPVETKMLFKAYSDLSK